MVRQYVPWKARASSTSAAGWALTSAAFCDFTTDAYGIDIDTPRVIEGAEAGLQGLGVALSESLPFADGVFDGVLLNEVIEHVGNDRDTIREALARDEAGRPRRHLRAEPLLPVRDARRVPGREVRLRQHPAGELPAGPAAQSSSCPTPAPTRGPARE